MPNINFLSKINYTHISRKCCNFVIAKCVLKPREIGISIFEMIGSDPKSRTPDKLTIN